MYGDDTVNLVQLFVILAVGLGVLFFVLRAVFGIDLTDTSDQRNRLIIGGAAVLGFWWVLSTIGSGGIGRLGRQVERGDDRCYVDAEGNTVCRRGVETRGLLRVAKKLSAQR